MANEDSGSGTPGLWGGPAPASAPRRLAAPPLPADVIARTALWERLDAACAAGKVVLLAAGAGYGKSVALSSWAQQRAGACAWVTLDALDDDPRQLAADLLASLQHALAGSVAAESLERLEPPPGFLDAQRFADSLLDALGRADPGDNDLLLVIDDAQRMTASEESAALLEYVLRWAPAGLRIALAARSDPPSLSRMMLAGRLEILRQRDLAFTAEETARLLTASHLALSAELAQSVHAAVGGWPAGVRLAALSLRDSPDTGAAVAAFASRDQALSDYLVGEVLDHLPDRLRTFVLRATVDDEVCASLLDAVTDRTDSEALLAACERQNLFLTVARDDPDRRWYAWHQVFASHMRRRHAYEDPELAGRDARAAARWWAPVDPLRAARHLLAGGDPDAAGDLLARSWLTLTLRGVVAPVLALADDLPPSGPYAAEAELARAMAGVQGRRADSARAALDRARLAAQDLPAGDRAVFEARAGVLRLLLVRERGDLTDAVEAARTAAQAMESHPEPVDLATTAFVSFGVGMGHARLQTELPTAIERLQRACELSAQADLPVVDLMARAELCVPLISTGRLGEVATHAEATLVDAAARGWEALPLGVAKGYLGWFAYWQDRVDEARALLGEALGETLETDWANRLLIVYFHALACLALGDLDAVRGDIAAAQTMMQTGSLPPYADSMLLTLHAELAAAGGQLGVAVRQVDEEAPQPAYRLALCAWADLLRRAGRPKDCLDLLDTVPSADHFPQVWATIGVIRSLAWAASGDDAASRAALESALAAAQPDHLLRPFMGHRDEVRDLLVEHQRTGTARPELVALLLDRINSVDPPPARGPAQLTPRELSILAYLPTPMSTAEIAASRTVSVNTVKSQLASIYRKLGVDSRRAAVRRADELGLLGGER